MNQHIVLVWVGWTGMSSLAFLFHDLWYTNLIGIDQHESELTKKLASHGIDIIIWHGTYQVQQHDLVIYSDAAANSPEVKAAKAKVLNNNKRVFPPMTYFQFLWELSKYFTTVSVAGTHGKSTTTSLTASACYEHVPHFGLGIVWATVTQRWGKNYLLNSKHTQFVKNIIDHIISPKAEPIGNIMKQLLFVVEADEFNQHFLYLDTDYAIITNIELDHADVYGTFENYLETFIQFANNVRHQIFVLPEAKWIKQFCLKSKVETSRHAEEETQLTTWASPIYHSKIIEAHYHQFDFQHLLGSHNHSNASLALTCTKNLIETTDVPLDKGGAPQDCGVGDLESTIKTTLSTFKGLRRRGELLWHNEYHVPIISDYWHHPTELASTLVALLEKYPDQKITCIFQPHQARRVFEFRDEFVDVLQKFDTCIIYDIYAARENFNELKSQFSTLEFSHEVSRHTEEKTQSTTWVSPDNHSKNIETYRHPRDLDVPWTDWMEHSKSESPDFSTLTSINDLWHLLATHSSWTYTTDFNDIKNTLSSTSEGVIIIFSAGNLDRNVRKYLEKNH